MSELSDLSELLTGAIVAQASVTRVVHADQLDEIRAELGSPARGCAYVSRCSGQWTPRGPERSSPPFASAAPRKERRKHMTERMSAALAVILAARTPRRLAD